MWITCSRLQTTVGTSKVFILLGILEWASGSLYILGRLITQSLFYQELFCIYD